MVRPGARLARRRGRRCLDPGRNPPAGPQRPGVRSGGLRASPGQQRDLELPARSTGPSHRPLAARHVIPASVGVGAADTGPYLGLFRGGPRVSLCPDHPPPHRPPRGRRHKAAGRVAPHRHGASFRAPLDGSPAKTGRRSLRGHPAGGLIQALPGWRCSPARSWSG